MKNKYSEITERKVKRAYTNSYKKEDIMLHLFSTLFPNLCLISTWLDVYQKQTSRKAIEHAYNCSQTRYLILRNCAVDKNAK